MRLMMIIRHHTRILFSRRRLSTHPDTNHSPPDASRARAPIDSCPNSSSLRSTGLIDCISPRAPAHRKSQERSPTRSLAVVDEQQLQRPRSRRVCSYGKETEERRRKRKGGATTTRLHLLVFLFRQNSAPLLNTQAHCCRVSFAIVFVSLSVCICSTYAVQTISPAHSYLLPTPNTSNSNIYRRPGRENKSLAPCEAAAASASVPSPAEARRSLPPIAASPGDSDATEEGPVRESGEAGEDGGRWASLAWMCASSASRCSMSLVRRSHCSCWRQRGGVSCVWW